MSDYIIEVTTSELISKATDVSNRVREMQNAIDDAETLLNNTARYWVGEAGDKKRSDFAKKKKIADAVINRFREYPDDLLKMAGVYEQAEAANTQRPAGLPNDFIM